MKYRYILFFLLVCMSSMASWGQEALWQDLPLEPSLKSAQVGFKVVEVSNQQVIAQHQSNKSFVPASNLKLITTGLALHSLTPNFTFTTKLMYTGSIQNSVLIGDLYVLGAYDPTSSKDYILNAWCDSLVRLGITKIVGDIYVPSPVYSNPYPIDYAWGDMGNYYGAGLYPLNLDDNKISYTLRPGKNIGDPTQLITASYSDSSITILNTSTTAGPGTGDKIIIYNSMLFPYISIQGTIPMGADFTVKGSNPDPAYFFAREWMNMLKGRSIEWSGEIQRYTPESQPATLQQLTYWKSNTLKELAFLTNSLSNNLYAEAIKKAVLDKNNAMEAQVLYNKLLFKMGVDTVGIRIRDGSGMSPLNAISPAQMTSFLMHLNTNNTFKKTIPMAGLQGTVSTVLQAYPNRVRMKSGTMTGVTCYSGYVTSMSGKEYVFSLMVNHHDGKNRSVQKLLEKYIIELIQLK